jgi:hypothetical protein
LSSAAFSAVAITVGVSADAIAIWKRVFPMYSVSRPADDAFVASVSVCTRAAAPSVASSSAMTDSCR